MMLTQGSVTNSNTSKYKAGGQPTQQSKLVQQMHAAYSQAYIQLHREILKSSGSSMLNVHQALLQIQAPKVVHL